MSPMKVDLSAIDRSKLYVDERMWNGEKVFLVHPKLAGFKWTQETKIFRSSVWNEAGDLVSASFPKFVNWGEQPDVFPVPTTLIGATIMEKLDGSTLIVSKYKGNYMIRTRGTIDATRAETNGFEVEQLMAKYPAITKGNTAFCNSNDETWSVSLLFEWCSPKNVIILKYGDTADIKLIGIINHHDYSLWTQDALDDAAKQLGVGRPEAYTIATIEDLKNTIKRWESKEGVCVYHRGGQEIHKVKSDWYLLRHYLKSNLNSQEKVVEFWLDEGSPDYDGFQVKVEALDYELWNQIRGYASKILDAQKEVAAILDEMKEFVTPLKMLPRADAAKKITAAYGPSNRKFAAFLILSDRDVLKDKEALKKLLFQVLK